MAKLYRTREKTREFDRHVGRRAKHLLSRGCPEENLKSRNRKVEDVGVDISEGQPRGWELYHRGKNFEKNNLG